MVLYPFDKLLGVPPWCGAVMTRFAILTGTRAAAASPPGIDMLAAMFRSSRTGEAPTGIIEVPIPTRIEDDLEQRLNASARFDVGALRAGALAGRVDEGEPTRGAGLEEALLEGDEELLGDPLAAVADGGADVAVVDHGDRILDRDHLLEHRARGGAISLLP